MFVKVVNTDAGGLWCLQKLHGLFSDPQLLGKCRPTPWSGAFLRRTCSWRSLCLPTLTLWATEVVPPQDGGRLRLNTTPEPEGFQGFGSEKWTGQQKPTENKRVTSFLCRREKLLAVMRAVVLLLNRRAVLEGS